MPLPTISELFLTCSTDSPFFPPTELFNETWLLRLVANWFASQPCLPETTPEDVQPVVIQSGVQAAPSPKLAQALCLPEGGTWFSHARLPTAFAKRHKGDLLEECIFPALGNMAQDPAAAACCIKNPGQHFQRGGFAGAVRPDKADALSFV